MSSLAPGFGHGQLLLIDPANGLTADLDRTARPLPAAWLLPVVRLSKALRSRFASYPKSEIKMRDQITERLILQEVMNRDGHFTRRILSPRRIDVGTSR